LTDLLGRSLAVAPALRRLTWRVGRRLYSAARGEQISSEIESDGEAYVQLCALKGVPRETKMQVLDIGANQGDWTRSLLTLIPKERSTRDSIRIDLFEPVPSTRQRLLAALSKIDPNGLAEVHPLAMSDRAGSFSMAIMSETGGTNSLHFDESSDRPPGGWITVETETLSAFCSAHRINYLHLVKCDTEGHDLKVLEGARELLLQKRIDVFQFEYNHRWVFSRCLLKDVFKLMQGLPYRIGKIEPTSIELFDEWHPELDRFFQSNYVVISEHALNWFNVHRGTFDESNTYA
jgi:FkbM family methyltransferase